MAEEKKGFFKRLVSGLAKTRDNIVAGFDSIFSGFSSIDEDFYEELEEILIMGDIGINATTSIIENLKKEVSERHIKEPMECKQLSAGIYYFQMSGEIPESSDPAGNYSGMDQYASAYLCMDEPAVRQWYHQPFAWITGDFPGDNDVYGLFRSGWSGL